MVLRGYALIWLDEGFSVEEIAQHLKVSRQSIYNWASRFHLDVESQLADAPRCGRPCTAKGIIDSLIEEVIDTDPRRLDYNLTVWTTPLLVDYLGKKHKIEVSSLHHL